MLVRLSKIPLCPREVQGHLFKRLNRYIEEQRRVQAPGSPILSARRRKAASRPVSSCWVLRLSEKFSGQDCKIVPFVCASRHSYRQLSSMKAERATSDHAARGQPSDGFLQDFADPGWSQVVSCYRSDPTFRPPWPLGTRTGTEPLLCLFW